MGLNLLREKQIPSFYRGADSTFNSWSLLRRERKQRVASSVSRPIHLNFLQLLLYIGVGRFRILGGGGGGGQGLEYWGGQEGAKFPVGTWRRNDVDAT